jgi:putative YhbY family RNA-binding protein
MPLTSSRRSELRAQAHKLNPVVIIGDKGLTAEVVAEIDRALKAHELIKVRAATDDRKAREAWMGEICAQLQAEPVQQIGKVLVIYRENPEERPPPRPKAEGVRRSSPKGEGERREVKRTERRRSRTASRPPESGPRRRRPRSSR